ncbi:hypothetical protein [Cellulomonas olei]|uniref:hypothetical protein n=1 Tax=Cellulomonas sp. P4 TaxID=3142533 RepID=UPI0031BBB9AB
MTARAPRGHVRRCPSCGWTSRPSTAGLADNALRKHSCAKQRAAAAAAARGRARAAAVDRSPKSCSHPIANHQHGTHAMYVHDACRCPACSAANARYEQDRARRNAYGRSDLVDAGPVREHIAALSTAGVGLKRITAVSGVSGGVLTKLVYGTGRADGTRRPPSARVHRATADRILAVTPADVAASAEVDAIGTRRRLQALTALGWSVSRIATDFGLDRQALDAALRGRPKVLARTADAVRAAFDAIGDRRAPDATHREKIAAARARARAEAAGWAPPAAWDPEQLDDATATPPAPQAWVLPAKKRATLDLDEWAHLVAAGEDPRRAAARCGVSWDAVEVAIARTGHERARRLLAERRAAA